MTKKDPVPNIVVAPLDELGREIQAVLREDKAGDQKLLWSESRGGDLEFDGYCAVASAAYFFLAGETYVGLDPVAEVVDWEAAGRAALGAGLQPMQLTLRQRWPHRGESRHWWIACNHPQLNRLDVIDLTIGPDDEPGDYPYHKGQRRGFMQTGYKRPSKARALPLIQSVKEARRQRFR